MLFQHVLFVNLMSALSGGLLWLLVRGSGPEFKLAEEMDLTQAKSTPT